MNKRKLFNQALNHIKAKEYTIIVGPRQVGKTTLLKQVREELENLKATTHFLNLENHTILSELNKNPENIFKFISPLENKKQYLFIDEIQYLDDPSNFLKFIFDEYADKIKIIATGSSAFYIDKKFKDSLAGRKRLFYLYSLSFEEFLYFNDREDLAKYIPYNTLHKTKKEIPILIKQDIQKYFYDYMLYGGYPRVVIEKNTKEKKAILYELTNAILKRDILESNIRSENDFYNFIKILSFQIGNLTNLQEISATLQIARPTVENYIYTLEKIFYLTRINPFFQNPRKELTRMPKVFFYDTGIRNAITQNFDPIELRADKGALLENTTFQNLINSHDSSHIKFWRTQYQDEIDFIVDGKLAIEIKSSIGIINKSKYSKFTKKYPKIPLIFATLNSENSEDKDIMNIWEL